MAAQLPQSTPQSCGAQIYGSIPLPLGSNDSIRLLRILDDDVKDDGAPISCKMHVGSTSDAYIALSYMWGTAEATETIMVNGLPLLIRENLWHFLHQRRNDQRQARTYPDSNGELRTSTNSHYLWVDALCINQSTTLEKNHQVAMMGRIYSSASSVLIWLGRESEHLSILEEIFRFASEPCSHQFPKEDMAAADESYWLRECKRLYDHPYWSRAWILQECVLASELYIQCGSRQFSIRILSEFHRQWHEISPFEWDVMKIFKTRANWHDDSTRTYFWPWTMDHLQAGCFDPRDRIYSAIAIMDPALSIMPDYNKTALELFFEIADQHFEWDEHRLQKINSLAIDLEMVKFVEALQGYDWENAPPAVWQYRLEARAFYKDIKKRPNLTKSEFLAERQLLINKDVSNNEHGLH